MNSRSYDIDWLRVIAIGLLLVYHIAIGFQSWGVFIKFIQSDQSLDTLWIPMTMLNVWRIPLLFFISGMGVCFAMHKRNWKQLLLERTKRILMPFAFGIFFIVPVHLFLWQKYYRQELSYSPNTGHLWFLGNIFIYVLLFTPVFYYLKKHENGTLNRWFTNLYSNPMGLLLVPSAFILEVIIVRPGLYEAYALTLHGFLLGLLAFFFGFSFVWSRKAFSNTVRRWRWLFLSLAMLLYLIRLIIFQLKAPAILTAIESNYWIFAAFGFANRYLNRPSKTLHYLSQGAYPVYIVHMIFLYLASFVIFPLDIPPLVKFLLIVIITCAGCIVSYDVIIRKIGFIRPLFGLKIK